MKSNKAMTVKLLWQFENCVYILSARPLISVWPILTASVELHI